MIITLECGLKWQYLYNAYMCKEQILLMGIRELGYHVKFKEMKNYYLLIGKNDFHT